MTRLLLSLTCLVTLLSSFSGIKAQPAGFVDEVYLTGFVQATNLAFDANGRMYVAEKEGKIWIVDGGVKSASPLIDITEEVGNWGDYGLVGFTLDPNFLSNGYIYLMYVVDRHHLFYYGTPSYNASANEPFNATIGRITRYTAESSTGFTTIDYSSRKVLMGETKETGMPILHTSHGVGTILFGEDGTLLASLGDGASFNGDDLGGGVHGDYAVQALIDGILAPNEDVGAFRSQMLNSYNGKIIRIDPNTGEGVSSNPFYDAAAPNSIKSKVWAIGLRNPFRMTRRPGTGSHYASEGDPGVLFVGDVGSGTWEELNIVTQAGMNFGWPLYEGMDVSAGYMNSNVQNQEAPTPGGCIQTYYRFNQLLQDYNGDSSAVTFSDPCNPGSEIDGSTYNLYFHTKPAVDWKHGSSGFARSAIDGSVSLVGSGDVKGASFYGNASVGGVFYTATDFPEEYRDLYYHGDYGTKWIRSFKFNEQHEPDSTELFDNTTGSIVNLAAPEGGGGIYYIRYFTSAQIRRLYYSGSINQPPTADVTSDTFYTPDPSLTVNFDATGSTDPENAALTYSWDFGDGTLGVGATPSHTYGPVATSKKFDVVVTVTDTGGLTSTATMVVSLKNTPPVINSTSLDAITEYSVLSATNLALSADVDDAEQTDNSLNFAWQTILYHDDHNHPEPIDYADVTSTVLTPIGCDGPTYFYRVYLTVSDTSGLSTTIYREMHPFCVPLVINDEAYYASGNSVDINVFDNDFSEDGIDSTSLQFVDMPDYGNVSYDQNTGKVTYTHVGPQLVDDSFTYTVEDGDGDISEEAMVLVHWLGAPRIDIIDPSESDILDNKIVQFTYQISGDTTLLDHIQVVLDNQTPIDLAPPYGAFSFADMSTSAHEVRVEMVDAGSNQLSFDTSRDTVTFTAKEVGTDLKMQVGVVNNVGSNWQTVNLSEFYTDMVVIATPQYLGTSSLPAVARVRNATSGSSFEVKVQNPSGDALTGYSVHYLVVEAGVYTDAADGITMEAVKVTTSATAHRNDWIHEPRTYANTYTNPIVLGQVMTENDADWSNFWTSFNNRTKPPTASQFNAGLHVGEDTDITRASETIGMIIIESGSGVIRGRPYSVGFGNKTVQGIFNSSTGFTYGVGGISNPEAAVLSSGGMSSVEGGWPVLLGPNALNGAVLTISIDEDQISDFERSHGTERVTYFVVDNALAVDGNTFPVEFLDFTATPVGGKVLLRWATASEQANNFFGVERSVDGNLFEELSRVSSQGNSNEVQSYQTTDPSPVGGRSYYRLRQVDLDGTTSYSNIVEVNFEATAFTISPNPVNYQEAINIRTYLPKDMPIELKLYNMLGQEVFNRLTVSPGEGQDLKIPTANIPLGTYILRLNADEEFWQERIVIEMP